MTMRLRTAIREQKQILGNLFFSDQLLRSRERSCRGVILLNEGHSFVHSNLSLRRSISLAFKVSTIDQHLLGVSNSSMKGLGVSGANPDTAQLVGDFMLHERLCCPFIPNALFWKTNECLLKYLNSLQSQEGLLAWNTAFVEILQETSHVLQVPRRDGPFA